MVHACCAPVAHLSFTHPSPSPCLVETTSRCEAALPQNRRLSLDSTLLRIVLFGLAAMRAQWFSCCVLRPHVCLKIRASQEAKAMAISYKMGLSMFSDEARILHNAADSGVGDFEIWDTQTPRQLMTCGCSLPAILASICVASLLLIGVVAMGFLTLPSCMPVAANCSLCNYLRRDEGFCCSWLFDYSGSSNTYPTKTHSKTEIRGEVYSVFH